MKCDHCNTTLRARDFQRSELVGGFRQLAWKCPKCGRETETTDCTRPFAQLSKLEYFEETYKAYKMGAL